MIKYAYLLLEGVDRYDYAKAIHVTINVTRGREYGVDRNVVMSVSFEGTLYSMRVTVSLQA